MVHLVFEHVQFKLKSLPQALDIVTRWLLNCSSSLGKIQLLRCLHFRSGVLQLVYILLVLLFQIASTLELLLLILEHIISVLQRDILDWRR